MKQKSVVKPKTEWLSRVAVSGLSALLLASCQAELRGAGITTATSSTTGTLLQGSATTEAESAQVLAGTQYWDSTGALQSGTMADQGNWNMNASPFPGAGYFSALTSTIAPSNVCSGTTIFGAAGAAVCQAGTTSTPGGAANILATYEAWDGMGSKLTGTMTNRGALDAQASFPGAGYYNGTLNNLPSASQVASGSTILGVSGSYTGSFAAVMASMEHRDAATSQVSLQTEAVTNAASVYTHADPGYRAIPKIAKDDDGYTGGSVTMVDRTSWDTACDSSTGATGGSADSPCKCGLSGNISARIADCAAHGTMGTGATWDGAAKGNAGQGAWKLVTRTGAVTSSMGREVWQDQRTMLLWSSKISTALNWCKASGSNQIAGNPVAEDDPNNYCDLAGTYQSTAGQAVSACFEDEGTYFTQTDAGIDPGGKAGLDRSSTPVVGWRLPTKYDYGTAESNGIRFVMPDMVAITGGYEWSASVNASIRNSAWIFYGASGNVYSLSHVSPYSVRCVGR